MDTQNTGPSFVLQDHLGGDNTPLEYITTVRDELSIDAIALNARSLVTGPTRYVEYDGQHATKSNAND